MIFSLLATSAAAALLSPTAPRQFFATCVGGLEPVLAAELNSAHIGATAIEEGHWGCRFEGDAETGARAVLWLRSALRVMEPLASAEDVYTQRELYNLARDGVDWPAIITEGQTLGVNAVLAATRSRKAAGGGRPGDWVCTQCGDLVFASKDACFRCGQPRPSGEGENAPLTHSHFTALTVKNACCDAMRDAAGWRPSVDASDADVPLSLYVHRGVATLYRVLSGAPSMHKRGYRSAVHAAALKETLAAGLLLHAGYAADAEGGATLCDPMCGSATLPIEAALIATDTAPGLIRAPPPLRRWADADPTLWPRLVDEARAARRPARGAILANDVHPAAIALARRDAQAAGVADCIEFSNDDVRDYEPPTAPSFVVSNPPWDKRIEGGEESWRELGLFLKRHCAPSTAWLLSGNKELTRHLRMRGESKLPIEHAGTDLRFIRYDVLPPRPEGGGSALPPPAAVEAVEVVEEVEEEVAAAAPAAAELTEAAAERLTVAAAERLTVPALKERLRAAGLPVSGRKAELVERLAGAGALAAVDEVVVAETASPVKAVPGVEVPAGPAVVSTDGRGAELEDLFANLYK